MHRFWGAEQDVRSESTGSIAGFPFENGTAFHAFDEVDRIAVQLDRDKTAPDYAFSTFWFEGNTLGVL